MKSFCIRLIVFLGPILAIGFATEFLLRRIPNDYSLKNNFLSIGDSHINTLILGSSHSYYGVNPEYMTNRAFNAAYVSQSIDIDFQILKRYENHLDSLQFIVLPIDHSTLFSNLYNSSESWRLKNYYLYLGIDEKVKIKNRFELLTLQMKVNLMRIINHYLRGRSYITSSNLGWGKMYKTRRNASLAQTGILAAQRHSSVPDDNFLNNVHVLQLIIDFAKKHNARLLLYTSPAHSSYVENLSQLRIARTDEVIAKLVDSNDNVFYHSFLTDESFVDADFRDADHLNEIGARKLTLKIDSLLLKR